MKVHAGDAVRSVMARPVVTLTPETTLRAAAETLHEAGVGAAGLVGVVSERDVMSAVAKRGDLDDVWVGDVMSEDVVAVDPDQPIIDGTLLMLDAGVRHLPVVDGDEVVGMVSMRDMLDASLGLMRGRQ
jgi:CBS domain-containing protein